MSSIFNCPNDGHWLEFWGIQTEHIVEGRKFATWIRWDSCPFCSTWYLRKPTGEVYETRKQAPPDGLFYSEPIKENKKR